MQLEKPKIDSVRVTLTDPETNKSRSITLYGITRDEMFDRLRRDAATDRPKKKALVATA